MNHLNVSSGSAQLQGISGVESSASVKESVPVQSVDEVKPGKTDQAVLSAAGGFAAQNSADSGVRTDKVAALQQAISAGTYNVPTSAVADKVFDSLLR